MTARTLFDKIWDNHVVAQIGDGNYLVYVDRHLLHEGNTPHAFEGLRLAGLRVRQPALTMGVVDHVVPTSIPVIPIHDEESRTLIDIFAANCKEHGIESHGVGDASQGICHVVGPERAFTLPGTTLVCGDSHTSTHGAFGAWAFGVGISEVEHVFATQTIQQKRPKNMRVRFTGVLQPGVGAKDIILALIGQIGTAGGTGHVIEFAGPVVRQLSMEARMTMCNMAIEAGARAGIVAPDETTIAYLKGRDLAPTGALWDRAVQDWMALRSDDGAVFDKEIELDVSELEPQITWGTSPQDVMGIGGTVPDPHSFSDPNRQLAVQRALEYMGLEPGQRFADVLVDHVFIGSCTNSRIEDLRAAAALVAGRQVAKRVSAWVVPGSQRIKRQAEQEGLDQVFRAAGFDWRSPGCSMCLGMNPDRLAPQMRCASTSNRNFEGRQGRGARTHLLSPVMAAAAAISGHLCDVRQLMGQT